MRRVLFPRDARRRRGVTLMETIISTAIAATVMSIAVGVYVQGSRGFVREQAQSYVQFRTRTALDAIAMEIRSARAFRRSVVVDGVTYAASNGSASDACAILEVPSQDSADKSLFYYGAGSTAPNTLVMDLVIFRYNSEDKTLRTTVVPSANVLASDGKYHTSYRAAATDAIVAQNVEQLRFSFKDRDSNVLAAGMENRTASMDVTTSVKTGSDSDNRGGAMAVSISGVRLRNMRSGSIPGIVTHAGTPVSGARLQAIYTSSLGAYPQNTIVNEALSDASGNYEIYGLEAGTYTVKAIASGLTTTAVDNVAVPEEDAAKPVTVIIP